MTISYSRALCLMVLIFGLGVIQTSAIDDKIIPDETFEKSIVKPRVESMDCFVRTRFNSDIERHIKGFTVLAKKNAQRILGESTIYFPIIERKIKELGLPDDLKYLTVVESMLNPKAVSNAGAKGMWQLMPFIAEDYDLVMDDLRDDRFHVEKSAEAGLLYLKKLYERFENWELALAAYNCGSTRVRKTLKSSGKKTYWGIRHLLPRQTREFVPKLVAVKYLFHFYQHHALTPTFPSIDLQFARTITIEGGKSFNEIGAVSGVTTGMLSFMNPSYIYDPKHTTKEEIEIILPARVAGAVQLHENMLDDWSHHSFSFAQDSSTISNPYYKSLYIIQDTMSLHAFCEMHNLSSTQVWLWNEMSNETLYPGQEVFVYQYHDLILEYEINRAEIEDHVSIDMIDLREIQSANSSKDHGKKDQFPIVLVSSYVEQTSVISGR